jgi:hypothetical protein
MITTALARFFGERLLFYTNRGRRDKGAKASGRRGKQKGEKVKGERGKVRKDAKGKGERRDTRLGACFTFPLSPFTFPLNLSP